MRALVALALILAVALSSCTLPGEVAEIRTSDNAIPTPIPQPDHCRGDGAVQTWLLIPVEPLTSNLMRAYEERQVIEFSAQIVGRDDDPSRLPHRSLLLREVAEGITLTLDYQGDPPPMLEGQEYRLVAWANLVPTAESPATTSGDELAGPVLPASRGYELQVFDDLGLLFLGATDVDLRDDPLEIELAQAEGDCPAVPVPANPCVAERQVVPLRIAWGGQEVTLYPGQDRELDQGDARYQISLFRSRLVLAADPACPDYYEHTRSLRIQRVDPPPVAPLLEVTGTVTTTLTPTTTVPLTPLSPASQ